MAKLEVKTHFIGHSPNIQSVCDDNWQEHYGGIDNPDKRNGFYLQILYRKKTLSIAHFPIMILIKTG